MPGRAIFLNGGSSSGKSTIGRRLQSTLAGDWLLVGVDALIWFLPADLVGHPAGISVVDGEIRRGPRYMSAYAAFARSVAALVRAGRDVIIDDVLVEAAADQQRWAVALDGIETVWVGVRCDPGVASGREDERGDRPPGQARRYAESVHQGIGYDIEVDTGRLTIEETVSAIVDGLTEMWSVTPRSPSDAGNGLPPRSAWDSQGRRALAPWER